MARLLVTCIFVCSEVSTMKRGRLARASPVSAVIAEWPWWLSTGTDVAAQAPARSGRAVDARWGSLFSGLLSGCLGRVCLCACACVHACVCRRVHTCAHVCMCKSNRRPTVSTYEDGSLTRFHLIRLCERAYYLLFQKHLFSGWKAR